MYKLFVKGWMALYLAFALNVMLTGCEGKGQLPVHKKDAENIQPSSTAESASEPASTSGQNSSRR